MSGPTLEQQRAADTWDKAQGQNGSYKNLAKGLPALIMNSGLLQVMAFLHEKGRSNSQQHCRLLGEHLRDWLHKRFPSDLKSAEFGPFMEALMQSRPATFQQVTSESMAWLRWMRQMAAAVVDNKGGQ